MMVLLEGKESMFLIGNIVRCMEDWMGVGDGCSIGGTGGRVFARYCE